MGGHVFRILRHIQTLEFRTTFKAKLRKASISVLMGEDKFIFRMSVTDLMGSFKLGFWYEWNVEAVISPRQSLKFHDKRE